MERFIDEVEAPGVKVSELSEKEKRSWHPFFLDEDDFWKQESLRCKHVPISFHSRKGSIRPILRTQPGRHLSKLLLRISHFKALEGKNGCSYSHWVLRVKVVHSLLSAALVDPHGGLL
jgi:hypothetical protein